MPRLKSIAATVLALFGIGWLVVATPMGVGALVLGMAAPLHPKLTGAWPMTNKFILAFMILCIMVGPTILTLYIALQYWKSRMPAEFRTVIAVLLVLIGGGILLMVLPMLPGFLSFPYYIFKKAPADFSELMAILIRIVIVGVVLFATPIALLKYAYNLFRFKTPAEIQRQAEIEAVYK